MADKDPYGNGTLVPSDHWGLYCKDGCQVHACECCAERVGMRAEIRKAIQEARTGLCADCGLRLPEPIE